MSIGSVLRALKFRLVVLESTDSIESIFAGLGLGLGLGLERFFCKYFSSPLVT